MTLATIKRHVADVIAFLRDPMADMRCEFVPHFKELSERSGKDRRAHTTSPDDILYGVQRGADRRKS